MRLVADESVDAPIVRRLREDGHDVVYIAELAPSAADEEVLEEANLRGAILLTADKDFGELVFRQRLVHNGIILLRLAGLESAAKSALASELCRNLAPELENAFSVVVPGYARIRHQ